MATDKGTKAFRHRESDHEMMHWQHGIESVFEPLSGFVALAAGAVPVAAAPIHQMVFTAIFAAVDDGAKIAGAAVNDGLDGLLMGAGHGIGKALDILASIISQDLLKRCHGQILSSAC